MNYNNRGQACCGHSGKWGGTDCVISCEPTSCDPPTSTQRAGKEPEGYQDKSFVKLCEDTKTRLSKGGHHDQDKAATEMRT